MMLHWFASFVELAFLMRACELQILAIRFWRPYQARGFGMETRKKQSSDQLFGSFFLVILSFIFWNMRWMRRAIALQKMSTYSFLTTSALLSCQCVLITLRNPVDAGHRRQHREIHLRDSVSTSLRVMEAMDALEREEKPGIGHWRREQGIVRRKRRWAGSIDLFFSFHLPIGSYLPAHFHFCSTHSQFSLGVCVSLFKNFVLFNRKALY